MEKASAYKPTQKLFLCYENDEEPKGLWWQDGYDKEDDGQLNFFKLNRTRTLYEFIHMKKLMGGGF